MNTPEICVTCGKQLPGENEFCPSCALEWGLSEFAKEAEGLDDWPEATPGRLAYFGDYELLDEIDRGGMGVVYRARQVSLNRIVAVKMILARRLADANALQRFQQESQASAQLSQPNIVGIYEVGEHGGYPYFSMEYIEGEPLDRYVVTQPVSMDRIAEICRTIAEAIQYAHDHGILHRDIKPSNIVLDALGAPHILDFGLAREMEKESDMTLSGQVLGSPNYMPPEQVNSRYGEVGKPGDVYSLGAVMFQMMTGRPPFQGESPTQTMHQVVSENVVAPRLLNPLVPLDLETICLKSLEKEPGRRFQSAQVFADELGRYLRREPIRSRPLRFWEKGWRWCRRKPALAGVTLALIAACLIGLISVLFQWGQSQTNQLKANRFLYAADMNLAHQAIQENNMGRARDLLGRHRPRPGRPDFRGWEWRYLTQQSRGDDLATLGQHDHQVTSVAFSPDGQQIASGSFDRTVKVWDAVSKKLIHTENIGQSDEDLVWSVDFSPDDKLLAAGTEGGLIYFWNRESLNLSSIWTNRFRATSLKFSPDGRWLGVGDMEKVHLWNVANQSIAAEFDCHQNWRVNVGIAFSPDNQLFAYNQGDGEVILYDLKQEKKLDRPLDLGAPSTSLAFSPDGRVLASGARGGLLRVWDLKTLSPMRTMNHHSTWIGEVQFSPDGVWLISGSADQTLRLWDTETWEHRSILKGHLDEIWDFDIASDGRTLVTGGKDDLVKLWNPEPKQELRQHFEFPDNMEAGWQRSKPSQNGTRLLTWNQNETYSLWNVVTGSKEAVWPSPPEVRTVTALAYKGSIVALAGSEGKIVIVDSISNNVVGRLNPKIGSVRRLAFSATSTKLAVANEENELRIHDVETNRLLGRQHLDTSGLYSLTFSPDGSVFAAGFYNGDALLWNLERQKITYLKNYHRDQIGDVAISFDNQFFATASADGSVKLWSLAERAVAGHFVARLSGFFAVCFSLDNQRVLAGSGNGQIKMWDIGSQQEVLTFSETPISGLAAVRHLRFLPDDKTLLMVKEKGWATWKAPSTTEISAMDVAADL